MTADRARKGRALAPIARRALILAVMALAALNAAAQLVGLARPLLVLGTKRFELYYPPELAAEADRLVSFADETYARLAARFPDGARRERRIPVLLVDGYSSPNGSYCSYPSDRIVLYVAPTSLHSDLGSFDDDLRAAFTHELAHALSLGTRSPLWSFFAAAFGDPVEPCTWTAPYSLIEGAAVASEGRGTSGRAKDPLAKALVRQDILEGRYKSFWQAAGAWDAYPFGRLPYIYGGLFSERLIEEGGEENYAKLWRRLGSGNILAGIEGAPFLEGAFTANYGRKLDASWEDFRASLAIREPVVMEARRLSRRPGYITALTAGAPGLYWADASAGAVLFLAPGSAEPRRLFAADGSVERLDLSPDGARLLVSCARHSGDKSEPLALVRDASTGRALGGELRGLREAAFAGETIVGIVSRGYATDLVLEEDGKRRVLLAGGPNRSYSSPASLDGKTVYCLAKDAGTVLVVRIDARTGEACTLVPSLPLDHLRSLALSPVSTPSPVRAGPPEEKVSLEGKVVLALSFAAEGDLYRLALVRDSGGSEATIERQETLLSGSVLLPVPAGEVYYVGRFSEGEYPCAYPAGNPALALREAPAAWAALDPSFLRPGDGNSASAKVRSEAAKEAPALPLLLHTYRMPVVAEDGDSAGILLMGADIAERLSWEFDALYDWTARGADLALSLTLGLDPWTLSAAISDGFSAQAELELRSSSASVVLGRSWSSLPARRSIEVELDAGAAAIAQAEAGRAYASPYEAAGAAAGAMLRCSSYRSEYIPPFAPEGAGADLALDAEWRLAPATGARPGLSIEAGADAALSSLGLACFLRAAISPDGSVTFGPTYRALAESGSSVLSPRYAAYREYEILPAMGSLYAFGEASANLLNVELQRRLSLGRLLGPIYVNRLGFYAGARAAVYGASFGDASDAELLSSAFGRVALTGTPLVGAASTAHVTLGAELSWAFRGELVAAPLRIAFLAGLSL